jgi:hypothetical protein
MIVFDRAYNYYLQFAKWTAAGVNFVCRLKDNAKYEVQGDAFLSRQSYQFLRVKENDKICNYLCR